MDELVAEKVMGLKPGEHDWIKNKDGSIDIFAYEDGYCNGPRYLLCGYEYCVHCYHDGPRTLCKETRPYSTDISAAWEVVEKLKDNPDFADITITYPWCVALNYNFETGWIKGEADTAPLAICRAALKALGVSE